MEKNKRIRKIVNSIKQPSKNCIWLKDGKLYYYSTTGWTEIQGQDKVNIEDIKEATITENVKITIIPSEGYDAIMGVTANVQVTGKPKTLDITKNGTYTVTGDDQPISQVTVNANVTEVATIWTDVDGMKYQGSTITKFQDGYNFAPRTGDNCKQMFQYCEKLIEVPLFDTSNATDMNSMFFNCNKLNTIPLLNTSSVTDMLQMFSRCYEITTIPQFDTSKVTNMGNMFLRCSKLTTVPKLDVSKVSNINDIFAYCYELTTLGGFTGLKNNLNLSDSDNLTKESLLNVINEAADVTANPKTLTFGETNLAKLTDEEKAIATNKGWILS